MIDPKTLIPHRPPMLLVDEILILGESEIVARKKIDPESFFLQGHYPEFPVVPGVITCECIFQAGAALMANRLKTVCGDKIPVVARIDKVRFRTLIRPGDELLLKVNFKNEMGGAFFLKGEARIGDKLAASLEFVCMLTDKP